MATHYRSSDGIVLFVYGALRSMAGGEMHRLLRSSAVGVLAAECAGQLYDTGSYPAAVASASPHDRIRGEAYVLPEDGAAELLAALDHYEGVAEDATASLFRRERTRVSLPDGQEALAWIYWYARPTEDLPRIEAHGAAAEWRPQAVKEHG